MSADPGTRPADGADAGELTRLVGLATEAAAAQRGGAAWLADGAPLPPYDEWVEAALQAEPPGLVLGTLDGVPVGVAQLSRARRRDGELVAEIALLYVEPDAREVGVGEALVDAAFTWASEQGCRAIESTALPGDRALKNLFERVGLVARAIVVRRELP